MQSVRREWNRQITEPPRRLARGHSGRPRAKRGSKIGSGLLHRLGMPPFFVAQLEPLKPKKRYLAFAGPVPSLPANNPKS